MRDGDVRKGEFRNNNMEGPFDLIAKMGKEEIARVFKNAQKANDVYITINKNN